MLANRTTSGSRPAAVAGSFYPASADKLGRTVAAEHPELRCTCVDLDPASPPDALLAELTAADDEDQVALRSGRRFVARLMRRTDEPRADEPLRVLPDVSYLITGGLGALGLRVARWLADHGARHLVLTGRRGPTKEAQQALDELRQSGVQILLISADVASPDDVAGLLRQVPLCVHATMYENTTSASATNGQIPPRTTGHSRASSTGPSHSMIWNPASRKAVKSEILAASSEHSTNSRHGERARRAAATGP